MAYKKEIKDSEARILIFLSQVPKLAKSLNNISMKLNIDYNYCIKILDGMKLKGWVFKHKFSKFMFYDLTSKAPIEKAARTLSLQETEEIDNKIQRTLKEYGK